MRKQLSLIVLLVLIVVGSADAAKDDCTNLNGSGFEPAFQVNNESLHVKNDYDTIISESTADDVTYLALVGGDQPQANRCGLNPKNNRLNWTGWGGPIDTDNAAIGHGPGRRNDLVIGGVYFDRAIGVHPPSTIVYDLTGDDYVRFEGYIGMSDEQDPANCGHGGSSFFTFNIDNQQVYQSDLVYGSANNQNVAPIKVEFNIPLNAQELEIVIDGGENNSCDHASVGDPKLLSGTTVDTTTPVSIETTTAYQRSVRVIYFVPNDRTPQSHIPIALRTQIKDVQQLYAEQMETHGYGRKTFEVETDTAGNIVVHQITGNNNDAYYHTDTLRKIGNEINPRFNISKDVYVIVVDSSTERVDGQCGIAWYDGGPAFVAASGYCIPNENEAIALIAHELGHAFNLEHDFRDDSYFMSYGAERHSFSECATSILSVNRYFTQHAAPDKPATLTLTTTKTYPEKAPAQTVAFQVNDPDGIHQIDLILPHRAITDWTNLEDRTLFSCKAFSDTQSTAVSFELPPLFTQYPANFVGIRVIDINGNVSAKDWTLTAGDVPAVENYPDVNRDGVVNLVDLVIVASRYGERITGDPTPNPDVNRDGIVDVADIILVTNEMPVAFAPDAYPIQTLLLPNYPNPFNPETWIPYILSEPADVAISIYAINGRPVRYLNLGFQDAGFHINRHQAAYWDGRNKYGEPVASGVYFYTLTAHRFTATQKMLIRK